MRPALLVCLLVFGVVRIAWAPAAALGQKEEPVRKRSEYELRLIRVGNTFQGIRFKSTTGETWRMDGDRFEKIPESGPIPAGDYEVTLVTDDTNWMAFRIDRVSGATWQMRGNKWHKVKEPE
jgi:hypothetical protein